MPNDLRARYTLDGAVPVQEWYFDNRRFTPVRNTAEVYAKTLKAIADGAFKYYGDTLSFMHKAFAEFPLEGKTVLVYGLAGCNCDALALYYGAKQVLVVDYNPPLCEHPQVRVLTMADFAESGLQADVAISISSFEHDGLGRYGDPYNPDGDLQAMQAAARHVTKDGLMFLAVPIGRDCLVWNAHRIYGPRRLPMLLEKWNCLNAFGFAPSDYERPLGNVYQPVLVLSNSPEITHIPDSADARQKREISDLARHGAFDRAWYARAYPETLASGMDAVSHYVLLGAAAGMNPAPWFDSAAYLARYKDVADAGVNPFWHYLQYGMREGRQCRG